MSTFVSVGNATQSFGRLLEEVGRLALTMPQPVVVQRGETPFQSDSCRVIPFIPMSEFERMVAEAELVILHAGAGSVIHAVRAGKVPVVMPRRVQYGEIVDDHQVEFAKALSAVGRVVVADELMPLADAVQHALELQRSALRTTGAEAMLVLVEEALAGYASRFQ